MPPSAPEVESKEEEDVDADSDAAEELAAMAAFPFAAFVAVAFADVVAALLDAAEPPELFDEPDPEAALEPEAVFDPEAVAPLPPTVNFWQSSCAPR